LNGVHVAVGAKPVFVRHTSFRLSNSLAQDKWIMFDDASARVLSFEKQEHGEDGAIEIYAITPEPPVVEGRFDMLTMLGSLCDDGLTNCNVFDDAEFLITPEIAAGGSATFKLIDDQTGLAFIGIYTSPVLGSSTASNYIDGRSGVVAFIESGIEIPTPETESGSDGASDAEKASGAGADGGSLGGISAAGGCKMSISSSTQTPVFFTPWWVVLMLAAMLPARAFVRSRKK
jgi:hypothetical protein